MEIEIEELINRYEMIIAKNITEKIVLECKYNILQKEYDLLRMKLEQENEKEQENE